MVANLARLAHTGGGSFADVAVGIGARALAKTRRAATRKGGDDVSSEDARRSFIDVDDFQVVEENGVESGGAAHVIDGQGAGGVDGAFVERSDEGGGEVGGRGGHGHGGCSGLEPCHRVAGKTIVVCLGSP